MHIWRYSERKRTYSKTLILYVQPSYMQRKNTTINSVLEVISFKDNSWKFCYLKKALTINSIFKIECKDFILPSNQKELLYQKESKGVKRDFFDPDHWFPLYFIVPNLLS